MGMRPNKKGSNWSGPLFSNRANLLSVGPGILRQRHGTLADFHGPCVRGSAAARRDDVANAQNVRLSAALKRICHYEINDNPELAHSAKFLDITSAPSSVATD
jgi:hypothetical protein